MKNNLLKFYTVALYLCSTVVLFAQDPGAEDESGSLGGDGSTDGTGLPIGDYLWVIALAVVVYAFWKIRALQNTRIQD